MGEFLFQKNRGNILDPSPTTPGKKKHPIVHFPTFLGFLVMKMTILGCWCSGTWKEEGGLGPRIFTHIILDPSPTTPCKKKHPIVHFPTWEYSWLKFSILFFQVPQHQHPKNAICIISNLGNVGKCAIGCFFLQGFFGVGVGGQGRRMEGLGQEYNNIKL